MMTRFRPVLAWQANNGQATGEIQLDFIQKYYGTNHWGYTSPHPLNYYLWCGSGALYYYDLPLNQDTDFQNTVSTDSLMASAYGLPYCNYEGGISFDGNNDTDWSAKWVTTAILDHHKYYEQHGGNLLMYYALGSTDENSLSFIKNIKNLNTPKYQALTKLASQTTPWANTFGTALPLHKEGNDFSYIKIVNNWNPPGTGSVKASPLEAYAYHFNALTSGNYKLTITYRSNSPIDLNIYAGSNIIGTITTNTKGRILKSSTYQFSASKGLQAIRIENYGQKNFDIVSVYVTKSN